MGLLDGLGRVAHWVARQKHHKELALLERAFPHLRIIEQVAEEIEQLGLSGKKPRLAEGARILAKRFGRDPSVAELLKLREALRG